MAYLSPISACEPSFMSGSTLIVNIEIVLSLLRTISNVRNCSGNSLNDFVSTSQKLFSGCAGSVEGNAVTLLRCLCPDTQSIKFGNDCNCVIRSFSLLYPSAGFSPSVYYNKHLSVYERILSLIDSLPDLPSIASSTNRTCLYLVHRVRIYLL